MIDVNELFHIDRFTLICTGVGGSAIILLLLEIAISREPNIQWTRVCYLQFNRKQELNYIFFYAIEIENLERKKKREEDSKIGYLQEKYLREKKERRYLRYFREFVWKYIIWKEKDLNQQTIDISWFNKIIFLVP